MACLALSSKQCRYVRFLYGAGLAIGKYGEGGCTVRVLSGADVVPAIRAADGMDDTDSGGHGSILNERAKKKCSPFWAAWGSAYCTVAMAACYR